MLPINTLHVSSDLGVSLMGQRSHWGTVLQTLEALSGMWNPEKLPGKSGYELIKKKKIDQILGSIGIDRDS